MAEGLGRRRNDRLKRGWHRTHRCGGGSQSCDEALEYAPNWKQLKEARNAVAKQKT
jgi:hypothetical protein